MFDLWVTNSSTQFLNTTKEITQFIYFLLYFTFLPQRSLLCQNSVLAENFDFWFLMSHICKDLGSVLLPRLLVFFWAQSLLLSSPYLSLILLDFLPFHDHFERIVVYCIFSLFFLSWVGVFARTNLTFFFLVRFFLRTDGSCSCYSDVTRYIFPTYSFVSCNKSCAVWQGNVGWNSSSSKYNFLSYHLLRQPPKKFLNKVWAISPRNGTAAEAISPSGKPFLLCFLYIFFLLFLPPLYHTPFLTDCFPLIPANRHQSDWLCMFYVLEWGHF